jgi:hypothetical protein
MSKILKIKSDLLDETPNLNKVDLNKLIRIINSNVPQLTSIEIDYLVSLIIPPSNNLKELNFTVYNVDV